MEEKLPFKDPFGRVQPGKSDVDFQDVFGGPPRRHSSIHERGRARADSFDFLSSQRNDLVPARRHWSGPGEKPAFGEAPGRNSSSRRRNFGDEFFSDIFPGSDSAGSTPMRVDTDVLSSNSGSRVHSPKGIGQTKHEPVSSSGSSVPAQASFSLKFAKGHHKSDDALSESYSSPSSPSASVASSTTNRRSDNHSVYRPTSSSRLASHATKNESKKSSGSASMESYINSSNFHFSFYRWAGKGVSLKLHNVSKEGDDESRSITGLPEVVLQGVDLLTDNDDDSTSTSTGASKGLIETEKLDEMGLDKMEDLEKESLHSTDLTVKSGHSTQREELQSTAESKSHSRNLVQLIVEDSGKPGYGFVDSQIEDNEVKGKAEPQHGTVSEEKMLSKKVKVKVRDLFKRFSPEVSPKRDQKMRKKDKNKIKGEGQVPLSPSVSESNGEEKSTESKIKEAFVLSSSQLPQVNNVQEKVQEMIFESNGKEKSTGLKIEEAFAFASSQLPQIHQVQQKVWEEVFDFSSESNRTDPSFERNQTVQPISAFFVTVERAREVQNESRVEDFEECLIEHSIEEQCQALNTNIEQDQMKISESKVREWSRGKEGNIRSLLSTLQYVLWPGSGWKPVPLVSIIEAPAVRKAYQRALLCLHPDKLQQRGAAPHEKYIAEKVFEILQEAWNEFSL